MDFLALKGETRLQGAINIAGAKILPCLSLH